MDWLSAEIVLTPDEEKNISFLRDYLFDNVDIWNEEELKYYFLGPLMLQVNYQTEHYRSFLKRTLTATINDITISGIVDMMIAKGKLNPHQPYFCLHEYKREKGKDSDPLGQLLVEMLAAQTENKTQHPVYGIYIIGRMWVFVVLEGNLYSVSDGYIATKDDIFQIFSILKKLKVLIEKVL